MKTITLQKPDGTKFQVNDRRKPKLQRNFHVYGPTGQAEGKPVNSSPEPEPLLPTGIDPEDNSVQSNKQEPQQPMFPIGVNPE